MYDFANCKIPYYLFSSHKTHLLHRKLQSFSIQQTQASLWVIQRKTWVQQQCWEKYIPGKPHFLDIFDQRYTIVKHINAKRTTWTIWFEPFRTILLFNLLRLFFTPAWAFATVICCIKTDKNKVLRRQACIFFLKRYWMIYQRQINDNSSILNKSQPKHVSSVFIFWSCKSSNININTINNGQTLHQFNSSSHAKP